MLIAMKIGASAKAGLVAATVALAAVPLTPDREAPAKGEPETVVIAASPFDYRASGEFISAGKSVDAPRMQRHGSELRIMKHQVSAHEYEACVADGACAAQPRSAPRGDMPAVQVNWQDVNAYAAWLSHRTGAVWRLPSDEEWTFAAAERAADDALIVSDAANPALRWLARYDKEYSAADDARIQPRGARGVNSKGVADLAGNVWEWTSACFTRHTLDSGEAASGDIENCGVRVVQGEHRSYMTDFIRDPKSGGCAVGKPPAHLGFRLVREEAGLVARLRARIARIRT